MADASGPRDVHDRLIKHVYSRKEAFAVELRRVLPRELLAHLDLRTLARHPTERTDERLRGRISDLCYTADFVDGGHRSPVFFPAEHYSGFERFLLLRAIVCAGDIWHQQLADHPDATALALVVPIVFLQHLARNAPTRLSTVLDVPAHVRAVFPSPIEVTVCVDDLSGSVLDDTEADPATLALVELARAFLYAYKNPASLTPERMSTLAPLFDVLARQREPLATNDVRALLTYVLQAFEPGSPVRALVENAIEGRPREMFISIADSLIAEGELKGRAAGKAEALLGVLEDRALSIPEFVRERVSCTRDEHQLRRWLHRAVTAASAEDIFDDFDG